MAVLILVLAAILQPGSPGDQAVLEQALAAYKQARAEPTSVLGREQAARAAALFRDLNDRGYRSAPLLQLMGNAYVLSGDYPRAIWSYECGLQLCPGNRQMPESLWHCWRELHLEGTPTGVWRHRLYYLIPACFVGLTALACGAAIMAVWGLRLQRLGFMGASTIVWTASVLLTLGLVATERQWSSKSDKPLLVITENGAKLRKGNGLSYPIVETEILRCGTVGKLVSQRGSWVQVELPDGAMGWLSSRAVCTDGLEAIEPHPLR